MLGKLINVERFDVAECGAAKRLHGRCSATYASGVPLTVPIATSLYRPGRDRKGSVICEGRTRNIGVDRTAFNKQSRSEHQGTGTCAQACYPTTSAPLRPPTCLLKLAGFIAGDEMRAAPAEQCTPAGAASTLYAAVQVAGGGQHIEHVAARYNSSCCWRTAIKVVHAKSNCTAVGKHPSSRSKEGGDRQAARQWLQHGLWVSCKAATYSREEVQLEGCWAMHMVA